MLKVAQNIIAQVKDPRKRERVVKTRQDNAGLGGGGGETISSREKGGFGAAGQTPPSSLLVHHPAGRMPCVSRFSIPLALALDIRILRAYHVAIGVLAHSC